MCRAQQGPVPIFMTILKKPAISPAVTTQRLSPIARLSSRRQIHDRMAQLDGEPELDVCKPDCEDATPPT
jgi:hypothetical protein